MVVQSGIPDIDGPKALPSPSAQNTEGKISLSHNRPENVALVVDHAAAILLRQIAPTSRPGNVGLGHGLPAHPSRSCYQHHPPQEPSSSCSSCFSKPIKAAAASPGRDRAAASTNEPKPAAGKARECLQPTKQSPQRRRRMVVLKSAGADKAENQALKSSAAGEKERRRAMLVLLSKAVEGVEKERPAEMVVVAAGRDTRSAGRGLAEGAVRRCRRRRRRRLPGAAGRSFGGARW